MYRLPSEVLEKVRFPLASVRKSEVFELAKQAKLDAADRKESQDFIDQRYLEVLFEDKPSVPGDFVDVNGKVLGKHKGIEFYTIGQRRGLGVAGPVPYYVKEIRADKNQIVLSDKSELQSTTFIADDCVWPCDLEPTQAFEALVKIRLRSHTEIARVEKYYPPEDDKDPYIGQPWKVTFTEGQFAITPGQSAVMYVDNVIVGGGIIRKVI